MVTTSPVGLQQCVQEETLTHLCIFSSSAPSPSCHSICPPLRGHDRHLYSTLCVEESGNTSSNIVGISDPRDLRIVCMKRC